MNDISAEAVERHIAQNPQLLGSTLELLRALAGRGERLARALRECEQWMYDANDPLGTFERIADAYYRDTGYLRPGKDSRNYNTNSQENNDRFGKWCVAKQLALLTECRAALAEHDASASADRKRVATRHQRTHP